MLRERSHLETSCLETVMSERLADGELSISLIGVGEHTPAS
jgi:hypothetical protein